MTSSRVYAFVPNRRKPRAVVDLSAPHPARFYARLVGQALRYGLPAARKAGVARAWLARRGVPTGPLEAVMRRARRAEHRGLDRVRDLVVGDWARLTEGLPGSTSGDEISVLALTRRAALTVFFFAGSDRPVLVAKVPGGATEPLDREAAALREAEPARVGPRDLGKVGDAWVQEAIAGEPLRVRPLESRGAGSFEWTTENESLARGLERLATVTASDASISGIDEDLERASAFGLAGRARSCLDAARRDIGGIERSVLIHGDTSAQNCHFDGESFVGMVDWELARECGAPGFDAWNAALSYLEHCVGLARWSEQRVVDVFRRAWHSSSFGVPAHRAAARTVTAAGVEERFVEPLEIAFFARRLGRRMRAPSSYPTGPATAARMLELVCAR